MDELNEKFKEVLSSVIPITIIVLLLNFTISPLDFKTLISFIIGSFLVVIGLTVFLFGIDQGIEPIGNGVGHSISYFKSYGTIIVFILVLGFFISYAEPDLHILAKQVNSVTAGKFNNILMVLAVSVGIGIMMCISMMRILHNISLKLVFAGAYCLIFVLGLFSSGDFLAIAFDSSGATTGAITVPFMLALAGGISSMKKNTKLSEADSFGVIGISSTGAIIGVLIAGLLIGGNKLNGTLPINIVESGSLLIVYIDKLVHIAEESVLTLLPIIVTYAYLQIRFLKHKKQRVIDIIRGLILTYIGLVIFLLGVNGGFMEVGLRIGIQLASFKTGIPVLLVALLLGLTTVLAEPAVHVLTNQVEEVTGGTVKRKLVLIFLSFAVGLAIFMSSLRILVPGIKLWMYLLPGFGLAVVLSYFVSDLFVGMAIDAGGVASGPMTATFSLAFIQGIAAQIPTADVITDGFGMIAIVAMMPIIAIELLGIIYQYKLAKAERLRREQING